MRTDLLWAQLGDISPLGGLGHDSNVPGIYTYFGPFVDHDITLETGSFPNALVLARRILRQHYQHIVLHDYLRRRVADENVVKDVLANGNRFYHPEVEPFFLPLEFTVAGFRFGHTMVRNVYDYNLNFPEADLFLLFTFTAFSGQLGFDAAATLPEKREEQGPPVRDHAGCRAVQPPDPQRGAGGAGRRGQPGRPQPAARVRAAHPHRPGGGSGDESEPADAGPAAQGGPGQRQLPAANGRGGRGVRYADAALVPPAGRGQAPRQGQPAGPGWQPAGRRGPGRPGGAQRRLHPAGANWTPSLPGAHTGAFVLADLLRFARVA
jgi:hypothetical protein